MHFTKRTTDEFIEILDQIKSGFSVDGKPVTTADFRDLTCNFRALFRKYSQFEKLKNDLKKADLFHSVLGFPSMRARDRAKR